MTPREDCGYGVPRPSPHLYTPRSSCMPVERPLMQILQVSAARGHWLLAGPLLGNTVDTLTHEPRPPPATPTMTTWHCQDPCLPS